MMNSYRTEIFDVFDKVMRVQRRTASDILCSCKCPSVSIVERQLRDVAAFERCSLQKIQQLSLRCGRQSRPSLMLLVAR